MSTKENIVRIKYKTINKAGGQARFSSFASFGRGVAGATCKCAKCAVAVFSFCPFIIYSLRFHEAVSFALWVTFRGFAAGGF